MTEYYARADYTYDGSTVNFSIPCGYIDDDHIVVIVNDDEENPVDYTFLSETQVQLDADTLGLTTGDVISVRRVTPIDDKIVEFTDGNILDEETQNLSQEQVLYAVQEIADDCNELVDNMAEYVSLKETIQDQLSTISQIEAEIAEAEEYYEYVVNLVGSITDTYDEIQEQVEAGIPCKVTHNLFTLNVTDKTLSGDELVGWALQGTEVSYDDYPDAYTEILDEYENGTQTVYADEDAETYAKSYTGSTTGDFYIPYTETLAADTTIYSDITATTELGTITDYTSVTADKYSGSETGTFYTAADADIEEGTEVFSDSILTESLGEITDVKEVSAYEYEASSLGTFYFDSTKTLKAGRTVYSDAALTTELAEVTDVDTIEVDKYSVSTYTYFYVPSGTTIKTGVTIYADEALSNPIGTITTKGSQSSSSYYYYKLGSYAIVFSGNIWTGSSGYFYTASALSTTGQVPYSNAALTSADTIKLNSKTFTATSAYLDSSNNNYLNILYTNSSGTARLISNSYSLVSSTSTASYSYICIDNSSTKLTYTKLGTVSTDIIVFDDGANETYSLTGSIEDTYIQIANGSYETYDKTGTVETLAVKTDYAEEYEAVTYNGIVSSAGVAFVYSLADNGHKVVDSIYENQLANYLANEGICEFYLINQTDTTITLPTLDTDKTIYLCVGNTIVSPSSITTAVTKEEFNETLEDYVTRDELEVYTSLITSFTDTLGDISTALAEILGE